MTVDEAKRLNATDFALSRRQEEAARLVAEDQQPDHAIAATVGINKATLERWKKRPDFLARVAQHKEAFKDLALTLGFADKRARLQALNALAQDLLHDMADPGDDERPPGTYRKEVKISANGETVDQLVFDKAKADTLRGYFDDIAKELGERKTMIDATVRDRDLEEAAARLAAKTGRDRAAVLADLRQRTQAIERERRAG